MVLRKWIAKKRVCIPCKQHSGNAVLAVALPAPLGDSTLSTPTPTQPAGPSPRPASSTKKTPAATPSTQPASSLPPGSPMSSIHIGATPASAMDTTSPMTLSTLAPGTDSPIISYPTEWETAHVQFASTTLSRPTETARRSQPYRR